MYNDYLGNGLNYASAFLVTTSNKLLFADVLLSVFLLFIFLKLIVKLKNLLMNNNNIEYNGTRQKATRQKDEFDFKKILNRFLQHWKLYILSIVVLVFLGLMFIRYSTPLYQVNAQVLVQDGQSGNSSSFLSSDMLTDFNGMFDVQNNVYNELAILQTKDLLEKVINEMKLNITYYNKGDIRDNEQYHKSPFYADYKPLGDTTPYVSFQLSFPNSGKDNKFILSSDDTSFTAHFYDTINIAKGKLVLSPTGLPFLSNSYILQLNSVDAVIAKIQDNLTIELTDKDNTVINLTYNTNIQERRRHVKEPH